MAPPTNGCQATAEHGSDLDIPISEQVSGGTVKGWTCGVLSGF